MTVQLFNYLFFTTTCESALAFYAECGLGRIVEVMHYGPDAKNEALRGKIMHSKFEGPGVAFYASDNDDAEPMRGFAQFLIMDTRARTKTSSRSSPWGGRSRRPSGYSLGEPSTGSSRIASACSGC